MTNHVHLLVTPQHGPALSELLRRLDQRYVQAFNRAYERSGTLWEGRFRSSLVDTDAYVLACYRYIELNPVRAGMTADASEFRWSSHRSNESGSPSGMLIAHPSYLALGVDVRSRGDAYRMLFAQPFPEDTLATIRKAIRGARILGRGQTPT
jgi:putative transposase